jgi:dTMP kinase
MPRGRFITLEGGDGAGKSTQAKLLAAALRRCGKKVLLTREVGGTKGAEAIRSLWLDVKYHWDDVTELLLISAARRDHIEKVIKPALKDGIWVISDRFVDSTLAYQGYGQGLNLNLIKTVYRLMAGEFLPDLTIVLDQPPQIGAQRISGRTLDRIEKKQLGFHKKLRAGFLTLAQQEPKRFVVIDATQNKKTVSQKLYAAVCKRLGVS